MIRRFHEQFEYFYDLRSNKLFLTRIYVIWFQSNLYVLSLNILHTQYMKHFYTLNWRKFIPTTSWKCFYGASVRVIWGTWSEITQYSFIIKIQIIQLLCFHSIIMELLNSNDLVFPDENDNKCGYILMIFNYTNNV